MLSINLSKVEYFYQNFVLRCVATWQFFRVGKYVLLIKLEGKGRLLNHQYFQGCGKGCTKHNKNCSHSLLYGLLEWFSTFQYWMNFINETGNMNQSNIFVVLRLLALHQSFRLFLWNNYSSYTRLVFVFHISNGDIKLFFQ